MQLTRVLFSFYWMPCNNLLFHKSAGEVKNVLKEYKSMSSLVHVHFEQNDSAHESENAMQSAGQHFQYCVLIYSTPNEVRNVSYWQCGCTIQVQRASEKNLMAYLRTNMRFKVLAM